MGRKKRKFEMNIPDADHYIGNLKFKDLKREVVIRGMDFDDVINGGSIEMTSFLRLNFHATIRHELLDHFDDYQEKLIKEAVEAKGEDPNEVIHPALRLGYIAERDEDGNVTKRKRARTLVKKQKKKRERTNDGIFQGTKKALTFQLQQEGKEKADVIAMVMEQFPDASEKSIGIWYNRSKKLHK